MRKFLACCILGMSLLFQSPVALASAQLTAEEEAIYLHFQLQGAQSELDSFDYFGQRQQIDDDTTIRITACEGNGYCMGEAYVRQNELWNDLTEKQDNLYEKVWRIQDRLSAVLAELERPGGTPPPQ